MPTSRAEGPSEGPGHRFGALDDPRQDRFQGRRCRGAPLAARERLGNVLTAAEPWRREIGKRRLNATVFNQKHA